MSLKNYKDRDVGRQKLNEYKSRYRLSHGANEYKRRKWTKEEDELIIAHNISDTEISKQINRSVGSIQTHRNRLLSGKVKIAEKKETSRKRGRPRKEKNSTPEETTTEVQYKSDWHKICEMFARRFGYKLLFVKDVSCGVELPDGQFKHIYAEEMAELLRRSSN